MTTKTIDWKFSNGLTDYQDAIQFMEERVADIRNGSATELVWFVEHPPLYTAGTSSNKTDLLAP
ncbi:MAG: lipoyl(octanoyl) transferase LipB, partial [Kordiimonadaceae bacterium]|nr:lipoyl(octanoyl) transferase LipB [Kordiimonadaceae bacterium]